ncbi:DUF2975 domain-containing protein [Pseudokineococcus marinus]|uniref:DUF2975 domain-containing protein n=1 Tax=Pseudokineococcus marinus TaxID=351215 RepID=A0A849BL90_9ACTN|nr:DUF2975 domain-containing protein [Pseudokineococcus marinus]NNH22085.1 DUF2975 domain-containing protein [Pseudokineococcus marinus]
MTQEHLGVLRGGLATAAVAVVVLQVVVLPRTAADSAARFSEVAHLERPYLLVAVLALGAVELALLAAWRVLAAVEASGAPTTGARRWADVMAAALVVAVALVAGVGAHAGGVEHVGGPAAGLVVVASPGLLVGVVLLRRWALAVLQHERNGDRARW